VTGGGVPSCGIRRPLRAVRDRFTASVGGLSPIFWAIWWGTLVSRLASFVGIFLALYLRLEHGLDEAQAGWVVGLWGLGGTVVGPVGGVLTDQVGRRATMLLGLVLNGVSVVAIAFAGDPVLLALLSFAGGATQASFFPSSSAAITDVVPPADRPRAFGLVYWAMNLGLALGFFVAGLVPSRFLLWLFLADAGTTFLCAVVIAWKVPETRPAGHRHEPVLRGLARVVRDGPYLGFLLLHLAALVVFTQFQLALPLDMADHGVGSRGFSWLMAFNCLGVVLLQPWLSPLLRKVDGARLLATSALLFGIGYGLDAVVSTLPLYLLGAAFWTVGEVVGFPVAATLVADLAPVELRGRYQGAFSMTWGLGMALSPVVGGQVMHRLGAPVLWWGCLAAGALVAAGHLLTAGPRRRRLAELAAGERVAA
jgi:MFS family permease